MSKQENVVRVYALDLRTGKWLEFSHDFSVADLKGKADGFSDKLLEAAKNENA